MPIERPKSKQPIPADAQKIFTGKLFDVYQWQQTLFDGTSTTYEKISRPDTVVVIPITDQGEIILSEQEQPGLEPFLGCLGGRVDKGEDPLEAAKRELLEESGIEAREFLLWDANQWLDKVDWAIYIFIAKGCTTVKQPNLEAGEKIELRKVTFDQFLKITSQENFRDFEVALKVFQTLNNPEKLQDMKALFSPS